MRKILLIAIALMAMMGTAAAADLTLWNVGGPYGPTDTVQSIDLYPDGATWVQKELLVTGSVQGAHTIEITVTPQNGGNAADISVEFEESGASRNSAPYDWTQDLGVDYETLDIYFKAASGLENGNIYVIQVDDTTDPTSSYTATLTVKTTMIPEFPTIALPVAAILGLAFIFQRRKEEE